MNLSADIFLAIGLLLLALEHFGVPVPAWATGIVLTIAVILMFLGGR